MGKPIVNREYDQEVLHNDKIFDFRFSNIEIGKIEDDLYNKPSYKIYVFTNVPDKRYYVNINGNIMPIMYTKDHPKGSNMSGVFVVEYYYLYREQLKGILLNRLDVEVQFDVKSKDEIIEHILHNLYTNVDKINVRLISYIPDDAITNNTFVLAPGILISDNRVFDSPRTNIGTTIHIEVVDSSVHDFENVMLGNYPIAVTTIKDDSRENGFYVKIYKDGKLVDNITVGMKNDDDGYHPLRRPKYSSPELEKLNKRIEEMINLRIMENNIEQAKYKLATLKVKLENELNKQTYQSLQDILKLINLVI